MKDIYKKPIFYYILIPCLVMIWPLLLWLKYLPDVGKIWTNTQAEYKEATEVMEQILQIDPGRLEAAGKKSASAEFDYASAIDSIAKMYGIKTESYKLRSGRHVKSRGENSWSADLALKGIDLKRFAEFISTLEIRWADLQCVNINLDKQKGQPNSWDADLKLQYYY